MSNLPVETTEPDPAATGISNDQPVNKEGGDPSAPTDVKAAQGEVEQETANGSEESKEIEQEGTGRKLNGEATPPREKNGDDKNDSPRKNDYKRHDRSGQRDRRFNRDNESKYDPSVLPASDDPSQIRAQVEFYFGDSNLPTDNNLWERTDGSSNKPVSIHHIHDFKRMRRFQPYEIVVGALKESAFLEVVGEEGEEMVRRKVAYDPRASRSPVEKRSIYAKGFGDEEPSTQFDIEAFFTPYGPTNAVRLRRLEDGTFKGSVFVEFQDEQTADAFLALDPKPLWKGKHELQITSKAAYVAKKNQEIADGITIPKESWGPKGRGGSRARGGRGGNFRNDRDRRDRGRGDRDPDDWKKRREEDRASGFKDPRGHRKDRDHRGGRGRRDDKGPRRDDRNRERDGEKRGSSSSERKRQNEDQDAEISETKKIHIKSEDVDTPSKNDKKRAHEADGIDDGAPAKKVDIKSEIKVEAS